MGKLTKKKRIIMRGRSTHKRTQTRRLIKVGKMRGGSRQSVAQLPVKVNTSNKSWNKFHALTQQYHPDNKAYLYNTNHIPTTYTTQQKIPAFIKSKKPAFIYHFPVIDKDSYENENDDADWEEYNNT